MDKPKLLNSFHGTSLIPIPAVGTVLSRRHAKVIENALCGMSNCACAQDALGQRGPGLHVIGTERPDGSVIVSLANEEMDGSV